MQFCADHWTKLKAAISNRGLDHLVAKSDKEALENSVAQINNQPSVYDPLMDCHWMITNRALERGGLYLLSSKLDGTQYCPVCEALQNGATELNWIEGPADAAFAFCREKGLIKII